MKLSAKIIISIFFVLNLLFGFSQTPYPKDYFIPPLNFQWLLSGSFAELRANHFHSGIDIKTKGEEGKVVCAAADGYVSRIKISPYGFGKAIYITHPNGFTTVYGHLRSLYANIGQLAKQEQYRQESFDIDYFPEKNLIPVKKGDTIAFSGNSGSSGGPHLHFEIRDSKTEKPIDPQLFGFLIKDFIRPAITSVIVYPEESNGSINGKKAPVQFETAGWGPVHRLKETDTVLIAGKWSLAIESHDLMNDNSNKNGIARYEVYIDSVLYFAWDASTFAFNESRYVNSFIDYARYYHTGHRFMRTHIDKNNQLSMYTLAESKGIFKAVPGSNSKIKIVVRDSHQNESVLRFFVKGMTQDSLNTPKQTEGKFIDCTQAQNLHYSGFDIMMPKGALNNDIWFTWTAKPKTNTSCSKVFQIHNPETPLHDYIDLAITPDPAFLALGSKLVLAQIRPGKVPSAAGGTLIEGKLKARIREFGSYTIMADSTPPVIKPLNISDRKDVSRQQSLRLKISDNFSGIASYRGTLNVKWILMDYDAKNALLEYLFDDRMQSGENTFELTVTDGCGNQAVYRATLTK